MPGEHDRDLYTEDQLFEVRNQIAKLQTEILTLKVFLLDKFAPGQLEEGLLAFEELETEALKKHPTRKAHEQQAAIIKAFRKLKKRVQ